MSEKKISPGEFSVKWNGYGNVKGKLECNTEDLGYHLFLTLMHNYNENNDMGKSLAIAFKAATDMFMVMCKDNGIRTIQNGDVCPICEMTVNNK